MDHQILATLIVNGVILFGSGAIAVLARRAFKRSQISALRTVAAGFACLGVGAAIGGSLYVSTRNIQTGVLAQNTATAVGVLIVVFSLYQTAPESNSGAERES